MRNIDSTARKNNGEGRVTERERQPARGRVWVIAVTTFVVVAFIAVSLSNGALIDLDTDDSPDTTLIQRPVIPGEKGTDSTFGGTTARCKDGTYSFRSGGDDVSDEELCKDNGGVEQVLPSP